MVAYVMAAAFVAIGLLALARAPELQRIAVDNTRSIAHIPLLGASARWAAGPFYVPTLRIIGAACLVVALVLVAAAHG